MTTYEPGTVAMIRIEDDAEGRDVLAFRDADPNVIGWSLAERRRSAVWIAEELVTDIRPLVVLDLGVAAQIAPQAKAAEYVARRLREVAPASISSDVLNHIATQIEQQTRPPRPTEPTKTGARVIDRDSEEWVRFGDGSWVCIAGKPRLHDVRTWLSLCEEYGPLEVQP